MDNVFLNQEELSELEILQVRGGGNGDIVPATQEKCINNAKGCGGGVIQSGCVNDAVGCGYLDPKSYPGEVNTEFNPVPGTGKSGK